MPDVTAAACGTEYSNVFEKNLLAGKRILVTGGKAEVHGCDIRDAAAVDAMPDAIWDARPLDGLVNNAAGNFISRTEDLSPRAIDAVLNVVPHGSAYCTSGCGRRWLAAGRAAAVLSIVTSYAWTGSAYVVPSAMAKSGVLGWENRPEPSPIGGVVVTAQCAPGRVARAGRGRVERGGMPLCFLPDLAASRWGARPGCAMLRRGGRGPLKSSCRAFIRVN